MADTLGAARAYIGHGWSPIPVPHRQKGPVIDDWQGLRITAETVSGFFNGKPQNIGIILGGASGGLVDLDLDCPEAIAAAAYILPRTAVFGRASKQASHWVYRTTLCETQNRASIRLMGSDKTGLLEIRMGANGMAAQTIFPPSVHVCGESIEWAGPGAIEVAEVDGDELIRHARRLAAASELARNYPKIGGRHEAAFVLGGFLARCGWSQAIIASFVEAVGAASLQPGEKRRDMARTARDGAEAGKRAGFPVLAETFGEAAAKKVAEWLDYAGERERAPAEDGATAEQKRPVRAELITLENLQMERVDWDWEGWIASGKIHLIAGVPEAGKTTGGLSLCAIKSSGGRWPDGTTAEPGNVLIWSGEDGAAETLKPRLMAMGADPKRIWIVKGARDETGKSRPFNPSTDLPALALVAKEIPGGVNMLMIDPTVAVVGGKVDHSNNAGHREKLQPLVDFAEEMKCAVIGITHFTKGTIGKDPIDRVTGSLAFAAVARVVLVATKNKTGDPERMFLMAKNNLAPTVGGYGYSIVGGPLTERPDIIASRIVWGERLAGSARDLLAEAEDDGKGTAGGAEAASQNAQEFLETALSAGPRPQKEIAAEGAERGFSSDRLFRASKAMGIVKAKNGFGGGEWMWRLSSIPF
jgi:putative DNA primase/helicase